MLATIGPMRRCLVLVLVSLTLTAFLTSCASSVAPTSTLAPGGRITVSVVNGSPEGGTKRVKVAKGSPVVIEVTSDADQEIHLHGYDLEQEVGPAKPATFTFDANLAGVFEVEIHSTKRKILELEVK